jgi:hypothetical protein
MKFTIFVFACVLLLPSTLWAEQAGEMKGKGKGKRKGKKSISRDTIQLKKKNAFTIALPTLPPVPGAQL